MAALATVDQVSDRLGRSFTVDQERQVAALLDDASALVRAVGDVAWDPDDVDNPPPATVVAVTVAVVRRMLDNPSGFRQMSVGGVSVTSAEAGHTVELTRSEYRTVRRAAGRSNVGSVGVRRGQPYGVDWLRGAL